MRNATHMKHKAARARSRLNELTFSTFNVRTEAVNGFNGIGHIDTLLTPCAVKGYDACRRQNETDLLKSCHLDTASTSALIRAGLKAEKTTWDWTGDKGVDR